MDAGAQQHAADEVGRRDARRALDHLEAVRRLDEAVAVLAAAVRRDVVAVDDVLAPEVADPVELRDIRGIRDGLRHPAAGVDGEDAWVCVLVTGAGERGGEGREVPFCLVHHRGAFVLEDSLVGMDSHVELVAQLAGLHHGSGMS